MVSSKLSSTILLLVDGPVTLAIGGGGPDDPGGVGCACSAATGDAGSSWSVATPTLRLGCCLAETAAWGGSCTGEGVGVGGGGVWSNPLPQGWHLVQPLDPHRSPGFARCEWLCVEERLESGGGGGGGVPCSPLGWEQASPADGPPLGYSASFW